MTVSRESHGGKDELKAKAKHRKDTSESTTLVGSALKGGSNEAASW